MDEGQPLSINAAAVLIGGYRWAEHRLFEVCGAAAATADTPAVAVHLFTVSEQHAWHADLWADRLPALDHVDPEALTAPVGPVLASLLEGLPISVPTTGAPADPQTQGPVSDVRLLSGLVRVVLPRLIVGYNRHLRSTAPATDRPTIRALQLVVRDEVESWQEGEALLQSLLSTPALANEASEVQRGLERLVAAAGGGSGAVPWPSE